MFIYLAEFGSSCHAWANCSMTCGGILVPWPGIKPTSLALQQILNHCTTREVPCAELLSRVWLFATPWTVAHQTPLSMGILQARILEWVAMPSSRGSSQLRDQTQVSCIAGGFFTVWATREVWEVPYCFLNDTFHIGIIIQPHVIRNNTEFPCTPSQFPLIATSYKTIVQFYNKNTDIYPIERLLLSHERRWDSWPPEERNSIRGQWWGLIAQSFCVLIIKV